MFLVAGLHSTITPTLYFEPKGRESNSNEIMGHDTGRQGSFTDFISLEWEPSVGSLQTQKELTG